MSETFGQRLKALRKKAGLSQERLAEAVGVHLNSVSRWELDELTPKTVNIKAIARALGVPETDLLHDPLAENEGWSLYIKVGQCPSFGEVIDMTKKAKPTSFIATAEDGGYIVLGGDYSLWADDNGFAKIVQKLKDMRDAVLLNGIAHGGLPADA